MERHQTQTSISATAVDVTVAVVVVVVVVVAVVVAVVCRGGDGAGVEALIERDDASCDDDDGPYLKETKKYYYRV
jgi:hypothetical protein